MYCDMDLFFPMRFITTLTRAQPISEPSAIWLERTKFVLIASTQSSR